MPATNFEDVQKQLDKIRGIKSTNDTNNSGLLREFISPNTHSNTQNTVDDTNKVDPNVLRDEETKFREMVTPRVEFTGFNVYPNDNNVVFSGVLQAFNNSPFKFTLEEKDGCYFSCQDLELSNELLDTLKKLYGYYNTWADEWGIKINQFKQQ